MSNDRLQGFHQSRRSFTIDLKGILDSVAHLGEFPRVGALHRTGILAL